MATRKAVSADEFILLGDAAVGRVGSWAVEVISSGAGTFAITPRGRVFPASDAPISDGVTGATSPLDSTAPALAYISQTSRGVFDGSTTPIDADGLYLVQVDGAVAGLDVDITGVKTITLAWTPVEG